MRQELTYDDVEHIPVGHSQQAAALSLLDFRPDAIYRHHENEEHQDAGQECVAEIDVVVQPRVADGVCFNDNGLEIGHGLSLCGSFGVEHASCGCARGQFAHHAHIAIDEAACHEVGIVHVEGQARLFLSQGFASRAFGYEVETINLATLHGAPCFACIGIVRHNACLLESVEVARDLATRCCGILVHQADGQLLWQALVHQ